MKQILFFALAACAFAVQAQQRPLYQTTKVDGTDGVYVFRYGGHQSMFVVTKDGVIATDPISYGRPEAAVTYIEEIRKVSDPIKQRNFWYLYRIGALPRETREYVPKVFAVILIGRNPRHFGF